MAHFAQLDENNVVQQVIVVSDADAVDGETFCQNLLGGTWKQTSYNTRAGVHLLGQTPFRKNYAGIGYTYDAQRDAFLPPQPFASWTLNEETCQWEPPVPCPEAPSPGGYYMWNELTLAWEFVSIPEE